MTDIKNNETLTPTEKAAIGSILKRSGSIPAEMKEEDYENFFGEVHGAELQMMKRLPMTDRDRNILVEMSKQYKGGVEELARDLHCHPDQVKAALGDNEAIKSLITSTIDNMQFISEVIDRYEKYAPALESFDKIATKEDINAWLGQVDKMVGKNIDDPLRQAATSLIRLNEAQHPLFLACMEEYRKDPMLLSSVYFDKVSGSEQQHAKMDDVILRVNELGLDFHPVGLKGDIKSAEYAAKQAVRDRIVTPSARRFNSEQVDILKHYRAMFSTDTDTKELFTRLYDFVTKNPDVARKPEKWQTDTLKELNDLAEGITREQGQGLRR